MQTVFRRDQTPPPRYSLRSEVICLSMIVMHACAPATVVAPKNATGARSKEKENDVKLVRVKLARFHRQSPPPTPLDGARLCPKMRYYRELEPRTALGLACRRHFLQSTVYLNLLNQSRSALLQKMVVNKAVVRPRTGIRPHRPENTENENEYDA